RFACGRQFYQDLTVRGFTPNGAVDRPEALASERSRPIEPPHNPRRVTPVGLRTRSCEPARGGITNPVPSSLRHDFRGAQDQVAKLVAAFSLAAKGLRCTRGAV